MTRVTSADLTRANTSAMITQLDSTVETSTAILSKMNEFIYGSTDTLRGEGYNAVRAKLSLYVDAIRKEAQICQNLSNNVKACQILHLSMKFRLTSRNRHNKKELLTLQNYKFGLKL